ncbi:MAG: hypothetical protein IJK14_00290 [Clostridia bacterium]|nr:hypothetical protein [Clostridia bacterium]MBR0443799.1 hypothetical protein [Clostridia bacterium]
MAKERSAIQRKIDQFLRVLFLDEKGAPKSAVLLYSFLLAILFVLIYLAAYLLLLDPLEQLCSGASVAARNIIQYLVPAIAGSVPCVALYFAFPKKKQLVPYAFLWMVALLVAIMLFELLLIDWSDAWTDYQLFLVILAIPLAVSILCGGIPATLLYRKDMKKAREERENAPKRPSYYNT